MAIIVILLILQLVGPIILYIIYLEYYYSLVERRVLMGTTEFQVFWKIKWPSLLPNNSLYCDASNSAHSKCFAQFGFWHGGPNYSTSTLMYYLYEKTFQLTEYCIPESTGSVFLAAVMIAILESFVQFKVLGNDVEY